MTISFDVPPVDPDHNQKLAVSRLPPELMSEIFMLLCEASDLGDYSWFVCSHVCSGWRRIALDAPHLWGHVLFGSYTWMQLCIERSKSTLLTIEADLAINPSVQPLVSEALALTERIGGIRLRFIRLYDGLEKQLTSNFPMLTSLTLENAGSRSIPIDFDTVIQPYPKLQTLSIHSALAVIPPLPAQLVRLELTNGYGGMDLMGWETFASALQSLVELETLIIQGLPLPSPSASWPLLLPNLRELRLSSTPNHCLLFVRALRCPLVRRYDLDLWNVWDLAELFHAILDNIEQSPLSMVLHRKYGYSGTSINHYADPGVFQHAVVGFAYANARELCDDLLLDISFSWRIPLVDSELSTILATVSDLPLVDKIQWLLLIDWNTSPPGAWRALLQRLSQLQTLVISHSPPSGLIWDLISDLETVGEDAGFCPALTDLGVHSLDCSAGGWLARRNDTPQSFPYVNSYVDLDGARFLEVLICYLELRRTPLPKLKITRCFNYTAVEIKLLRRLVGEVQWDGVSNVGPSYGANGDEFGALTINHNLLSSRCGYEALNLSEDERWKRMNWGVRSSRPADHFGQPSELDVW
ncbi:hypothetical protein C8R47DRAFT_1087229 [Mycena vitilis]|nr:hypothetical protein C8R47DRAFT_1087229 [Mycena vitilis]